MAASKDEECLVNPPQVFCNLFPLRSGTILNICGLILLFSLLNWNSINAPFETDEGEYAYSAWLVKGGEVPYRNAFLQKPPMIIYSYLVAQFLGNDPLWPPHLLGALSLFMATILLGVIAAREFGNSAGWLSMWLFLPLMGLPVLAPFAANTEKFMILPMLGMVAVYVFNRKGRSLLPWFWSGVFCALAMYYKPVIPLFSLFLYAVWGIEVWREQRNLRPVLLGGGCALLGMLLTSAGVFAYFIYHGAFKEFWQCSISYNLQMIEMFKGNRGSFALYMGEFFRAWYFSVFLVVCAMFTRNRRQWFYLGLLLVTFLTVSSAHAAHYYIMALPMFALLAALGLQSCSERVATWTGGNSTRFLLAGTVIAVGMVCWPLRRQFLLTPVELVSKVYSGYAFAESPLLAKRVTELSSRDDYVFVAGSEPQILYYAKRKSPTRFVTMFPLMYPTPAAVGFQQEAIRDLETKPPKLIVVAQYEWSWWQTAESPTLILKHLLALLEKDYQLVGGFVRDGDRGVWQEPLDVKMLSRCSLTLYKRKESREESRRYLHEMTETPAT